MLRHDSLQVLLADHAEEIHAVAVYMIGVDGILTGKLLSASRSGLKLLNVLSRREASRRPSSEI